MRLTGKKIEEILLNILGEEGLPLIRELSGKENVSEFDLATKTRQDIKVIRKMLYILYNNNLVGFIRKKDKIKGWYIYYWTLLPESIRFSYLKMKRNHLERFKQELEDEKKELFFVCNNNCVRLNFDQAMDFEFHCPECGELANQDDGKKRIEDLDKKIKDTEEDINKLIEQRKVKRKEVKNKKKEKRNKKSAERKTKNKVSKSTSKKESPKKKVKKDNKKKK